MADPLAVNAPPVTPAAVAARPKRAFYVFCGLAFLSFLTTSTLTYLSVMLASVGMAPTDIGAVLGSPLIPTVAGVLFAGKLIHRYGALPVAIAGQVLTLLSFLGMGLVLADPLGAMIARFMVGLGAGLVFPAMLIYARGLLSGPNTVYWFGIFTSMVPLPNFIGPPLAEWYFTHHGSQWFFPVFALPLLVSIVMMKFVEADIPAPQTGATSTGYMRLLTKKSLWLPYAAIITVGQLWGFMLSFMALLLQGHAIPVGFFFTSATLAMLLSRFTIMRWLGRKPAHWVVAGGLISMSAGYLALSSLALSGPIVAMAGVVFGIGYSTAFPVLSLWVADQFPLAERGQPMALFTAVFQASIFGLPYLVAAMSATGMSLPQTLIPLSIFALGFALLIALLAPQRP